MVYIRFDIYIHCDTVHAFYDDTVYGQTVIDPSSVPHAHCPKVEISRDAPPELTHNLCAILSDLADNPSVEMFHISKSKEMARDVAVAVARIVMRITELRIASCVFTDEVCGILAEAVRASPTLKSLSFFGLDPPTHTIQFADATSARHAVMLTDAVGASKTCESLTLGSMTFSEKTAHRVASNFEGLKLLSLQHIGGCDHLAIQIANVTSFESLTIVCKRWAAATTRITGEVLRNPRGLKCFRLEGHAPALTDEPVDSVTCLGGLVELSLTNIYFGSGANLALAVAESTTLRTVRIRGFMGDDISRLAIVNAVGANGGIRTLDISGSNVFDPMIYAVASAVMKSPHLEVLCLGGGNNYSREGVTALAKAVATRWRLTEIDSSYPLPHLLTDALERSKANAALLAFCGGILAPRTPLGRLLRKTGDNAVAHRVLGFMITL
jgi:hypothetical protein